MSLLKYVRTLAMYDAWATRELLKDCRTLGEAKYRDNAGLCFRSVHGTLCHIYAGTQLWLHRARNEPAEELHHLWSSGYSTKESPDHVYETLFNSMDDVEKALLKQNAEWQTFLSTLTEADMTKDFTYKTTSGENTGSPLGITVCHVFNHATHHRGQASAAMSMLGGPVTSLDLIYFYRQNKDALPL
eukprot:m.44140 g.44140  ORF g.44140 m.44140 type:complete len:187 (+) comp12299_c0_seq1:26-586(+)